MGWGSSSIISLALVWYLGCEKYCCQGHNESWVGSILSQFLMKEEEQRGFWGRASMLQVSSLTVTSSWRIYQLAGIKLLLYSSQTVMKKRKSLSNCSFQIFRVCSFRGGLRSRFWVVADSVKKKLPVFVCLCLVFGYNYETILCHEKGIEGLIMIFFKSLVLLVYLYILVLWIVSRNFFLFLFFLLTYILLLRSLNNFVSLQGIKGFFMGLLY